MCRLVHRQLAVVLFGTAALERLEAEGVRLAALKGVLDEPATCHGGATCHQAVVGKGRACLTNLGPEPRWKMQKSESSMTLDTPRFSMTPCARDGAMEARPVCETVRGVGYRMVGGR